MQTMLTRDVLRVAPDNLSIVTASLVFHVLHLLCVQGSVSRSGAKGGTFWVACSSLSVGTTMTLSPWFQFTGVATEWLAVSCRESITRKICNDDMHAFSLSWQALGIVHDRTLQLPRSMQEVTHVFVLAMCGHLYALAGIPAHVELGEWQHNLQSAGKH